MVEPARFHAEALIRFRLISCYPMSLIGVRQVRNPARLPLPYVGTYLDLP